jgi:hypothetical protein
MAGVGVFIPASLLWPSENTLSLRLVLRMSMHYHSPLATHFEAGIFNRLSANRTLISAPCRALLAPGISASQIAVKK